MRRVVPFLLLLLSSGLVPDVRGASFSAGQIESFEKTVRPLLVERCFDCHGAHKHENGLRLDSREGILRGSDYGPVVVVENPAGSRLIHAVKGAAGVEKMPKKGAGLSGSEVAVLEQWIADGLPWPEEAKVAEATHSKADAKQHWAFLPVVKPVVPVGVEGGNALDALVGAKLKAAGLDFAKEADAATLYRRLSLTVTGLQPEMEEMRRFVEEYARDREAAWARAVAEMLASTQYGQKWARHWLDVARYSDTEGYQAGGRDIRFPHAYTYRNWVIEALNEDMPYDQFVTRQLAADHLIAKDTLMQASTGGVTKEVKDAAEVKHLAALGFLTVNDRFLGDRVLQVDDRIDVVTRGLLGFTVGCARCHDHKYDPIPSSDYYSLYSVFSSSDVAADDRMPVIGHPEGAAEVMAFQKAVGEVEAKKSALREEVLQDLKNKERMRDYLVFAQRHLHAEGSAFRGSAGKEMMRDRIAESWRSFIKGNAVGSKVHPVMHAWKQFGGLKENEFEAGAAEVVKGLSEDATHCNQVVAAAFRGKPAPRSMNDVAATYAEVFLDHSGEAASEDKQRESIRALMRSGQSPMTIGLDRIEGYFTRKDREKMTKLENEVKKLEIESPGAPHRAMAMVDREKPSDQRIMIRGNPGRLGDVAARGYLAFFGGEKFKEGSGRLELARKIASRENPLTARVMVNRMWMHHFGRPLVSQPSDFGVQTPKPVQADVLDYLAALFMEQGWSMKRVHQEILMSRAWRQGSSVSPETVEKDPENDLISRMNRQRMDYEMMRDNLLLVSGRLNPGLSPRRSVPLNAADADQWRSVLLLVDRYDQPTVPAMFDFANPDSHSPQRFQTTVPQQALFLMNSPFMRMQADALAGRVPEDGGGREAEAVKGLYERVLLRAPSAEELALARRFFEDARGLQQEVPFAWGYGTQEVERDKEGQVSIGGFTPFAMMDGKDNRWTHTGKIPDSKWGYAFLTPQSGHAGSGAVAPAAQWTAPKAMTVRLVGLVKRPSDLGNGVRVFVLSDRSGVLKEVLVEPKQTVEVVVGGVRLEAGERVTFAVGSDGDTHSDSFEWKLAVYEGDRLISDARRDFCGLNGWPINRAKPQTPLAQLAQVLMMSNEFQFVD
jgi:hypothetical protein